MNSSFTLNSFIQLKSSCKSFIVPKLHLPVYPYARMHTAVWVFFSRLFAEFSRCAHPFEKRTANEMYLCFYFWFFIFYSLILFLRLNIGWPHMCLYVSGRYDILLLLLFNWIFLRRKRRKNWKFEYSMCIKCIKSGAEMLVVFYFFLRPENTLTITNTTERKHDSNLCPLHRSRTYCTANRKRSMELKRKKNAT